MLEVYNRDPCFQRCPSGIPFLLERARCPINHSPPIPPPTPHGKSYLLHKETWIHILVRNMPKGFRMREGDLQPFVSVGSSVQSTKPRSNSVCFSEGPLSVQQNLSNKKPPKKTQILRPLLLILISDFFGVGRANRQRPVKLRFLLALIFLAKVWRVRRCEGLLF